MHPINFHRTKDIANMRGDQKVLELT